MSDYSSRNVALDLKEQGRAMVLTAATLQGQLIAAESELESIRETYSDNNVRVRAVQARIAELKKQKLTLPILTIGAPEFFGELVEFMTYGPVVVQVLEGENAMQRNRDIMGATNPANAEPGTIRRELAESIEANTVHGSDSDENAAIEIAFFFTPEEIVG